MMMVYVGASGHVSFYSGLEEGATRRGIPFVMFFHSVVFDEEIYNFSTFTAEISKS